MKTRLFGDVEVRPSGAFVKQTQTVAGRTSLRSLYVGEGLGSEQLSLAASLLDRVEVLDVKAREAIANELASAPGGIVGGFIVCHLEELDAQTVQAIFKGAPVAPPSATLRHLQLVGFGLHAQGDTFSLVFDYSFGREHSDQLLAVKFDATGMVVRVAHES